MFIEKEQMKGMSIIKNSRDYLDYLEIHLTNIAKAFQEVSNACDGMAWVGDDFTWHTIRGDILFHDISKFSQEEFTQYRKKFFPTSEEKEFNFLIDEEFQTAWENHKNKNHHHHETAKTHNDIIHMIVDWTAMGYNFGDSAQEYYEKNSKDITLDSENRKFMYEIFKRIKEKNNEQTN